MADGHYRGRDSATTGPRALISYYYIWPLDFDQVGGSCGPIYSINDEVQCFGELQCLYILIETVVVGIVGRLDLFAGI